LGTWRDAPFLGSLREGINFFIYGNFNKELERYVKKVSSAGSSLFRDRLKENLKGLVYWDF
jgi:hypothetical protein